MSVNSYADSSFQDSVENALADQIPFAENIKKLFNDTNSKLTNWVLKNVFGFSFEAANRDFSFEEIKADNWKFLNQLPTNGLYIYDTMQVNDQVTLASGHLIYTNIRDYWDISECDKTINTINEVIAKHPNVDAYAYYVEREFETDFKNGERSGEREYVLENINLPDSHKLFFELNGFSAFDKYFYLTDHHWNYLGSYKAYRELTKAMGCGEAIEPIGTVDVGIFSGSRAAGTGASDYKETLRVFEFNFPKMKVSINGKEAWDYGIQESAIATAKVSDITTIDMDYMYFYGFDNGETVFENANGNGKNILVIGDSFDNAILKMLASNYSKLYSVDLRYYKEYLKQDFNYDSYISNNEIDTILWIGSNNYWK
ncbi:MAG: DHHW family protein [Clostridia bacterium]|nr:DHHW family protein [Clostridia bacterium]